MAAVAQDAPSAGDARAYVRARAAEAEGQADDAVRYYQAALAAAPDDVSVAGRAYRLAVTAGDIALARRALAVLDKAQALPLDGSLFAFALALDSRDAPGMEHALDRMERGPLDFMVPVLRAWIAQDRGDDGVAMLESHLTSVFARRYAGEHRALLLIARGAVREGVAAIGHQIAADPDRLELRWAAAKLLARRGDRDAATALLDGPGPELAAMRAGLGRGARADARFGATVLFLRIADELGSDETMPLVIVLSRAALLLDPADARARLLLADAVSREGMPTVAQELIGDVKRNSPWYRASRAAAVRVLQRSGETAQALAQARTLSGEKDATSSDARTLGDVLLAAGDVAAAADAYALAVERAGDGAEWPLLVDLADARRQSGQPAEALATLRRARKLAPDEPEVLTRLGDLQVAQGVDLDGAVVMLERAATLRPRDAEVSGALAWGYFRKGDVARALPLLERAARNAPASVSVNERLGDVYWTLGRRFEARYAWRAAAVVAEGADAARIDEKLRHGLDTDG